jgi:DNA-directed RNA polymerase omega subunit
MKDKSNALNEDEKSVYENKFELIAIAAKRARNLRDGRKALVGIISDKEPVIALSEILSGILEVEISRENKDEESDS